MDVDNEISKYDEYVQGAAREVITVETKIKSTNKGFGMLAKLGWTEGQPLGISGNGQSIEIKDVHRVLTDPRACGSYPFPNQARFDWSGEDKPGCEDD